MVCCTARPAMSSPYASTRSKRAEGRYRDSGISMTQYANRAVHVGTRICAWRAPLLVFPALLWLAQLLSATPAVADELDTQRAAYRAAQQAAASSDWTEFFRLRETLRD